jgi:hypothetical protein
VSAGAAIDATGQILSLDEPMELDIRELARHVPGVPEQSRDCEAWLGSFCSGLAGEVRASQYWVVARRANPSAGRSGNGPRSSLAAGGEDDGRLEIGLEPEIPALYFLHGSLAPVHVPCVNELLSMLLGALETVGDLQESLNGPVTPDILNALTTARNGNSGSAAATEAFGGVGFKLVPQLMDFVNSIPINARCEDVGVVLGRVLLATEVPSGVKNALGVTPYYVLIDDAFPYRRLIPNAAANYTLLLALAGTLVTATDRVE